VEGNAHRPAAEIAAELLAIVEERWAAQNEVGPPLTDLNDVYLLLAYTRAFRAFETIRDVSVDGRNDDALVLLRSFISVILRGLWVVQPDDADERELQRRRIVHEEIAFEEKRLRLGGAHPGEEQRLPEIQELLRAGEEWFAARGAPPEIPNESDVADALGLPALYQIIYRIASKTTHFLLFSMVEGFDGPFEPNKLLRPIPLHKRTPEYTENILMWAIVAYVELLERADPVVRLNLADTVRALVLPWLEDHPYRVHPEDEPLDDADAQP
jgi:hypothetical protein